jgi:glycosyltransferase involved in cell wall biosynthesis
MFLKISVITAALPDAIDHLPECARSIRGQSLPPGWELEWVLALDGPGLTPPEVIRLLGLDAPDRCVVLPQHSGPAVARNMALAAATGELIRCVDADDILMPMALQRDIQALQAEPDLAFVTSKTANFSDDDQEFYPWENTPEPQRLEPGELIKQWNANDHIVEIHASTVCVRAAKLRAIGGWMAIWPNEDTAVLLLLNQRWPGRYLDHISHGYRFWDKASTAHFDPTTFSRDLCVQLSVLAIQQRLEASNLVNGDRGTSVSQ